MTSIKLRKTLAQLTLGVACLVVSGLAASPTASADEAVYVLTAGGISELPRVQVTEDPPSIQTAAPLPLLFDQGSAATFTDVAVLAGGHLMLSDASGRGVAYFNPQGSQTGELFGPGALSSLQSVLVGSYESLNTPSLLLMADNSVRRAQLYDVLDGRYVWTHRFLLSGGAALLERAILLPGDRVAAALNWPDLGISGVRIVEQSEPADILFELLSEEHPERPDALVLAGMEPLRDLTADIDGRLLITTRDALFIVGAEGELLFELGIESSAAIGGGFQSARWLSSEKIIAATRQPGLFNTPHANHRLHLIDPGADEPLLASSPALQRAPLRLEVQSGQGGTGTRDYFADLFTDAGDVNDLVLVDGPVLAPREIPRDGSAFFQVDLRNDGEELLRLRRLELRIQPTTCEEVDEVPAQQWWARRDIDLQADEVYAVDTLLFPADRAFGDWCARIVVTARDGAQQALGPAMDLRIVPPDNQGSPIEVQDLATFDTTDAGLPSDADFSIDDATAGGCACSSAPTNSPPTALLFALLSLALYRRPWKRRSTRRASRSSSGSTSARMDSRG